MTKMKKNNKIQEIAQISFRSIEISIRIECSIAKSFENEILKAKIYQKYVSIWSDHSESKVLKMSCPGGQQEMLRLALDQ